MKIAVVRALQLGDLLCATPALRALRSSFPQARITLVGLPWAEALVSRFSMYVDDFAEFPGFPGSWEALAAQRFDLAFQMHGDGRILNALTEQIGAGRYAGYYLPGHYRPDPERFLEWRPREHEVLRWLRLLEHVGIPARGTDLEFPLTEDDRMDIGGPYAVVHAGSQLASRRWPAQRFAEVADALAREGLRIVLTGAKAEADLTLRVARSMREPAMDLAGRTSLGQLAWLVARARLVVANDTGISHIAAAMQTPSVIIACGSDPERWAPLDHDRHRVLAKDVACRPCLYRDCPVAGHPCAAGITVEHVLCAA